MKIKALKLIFFVPFNSNHLMHMKINIVQNMTKRAVISCSNKLSFKHAFIALKIRFIKSNYPETFLIKHMDINIYKHRAKFISNLNNKRRFKFNQIIQQKYIIYKPIWIPEDEKGCIRILYDNIIMNTKQCIKYLKRKYPRKRIVYKLNNSIQNIIRCKDSNYDM